MDRQQQITMRNIILDTDIDTDCDDAGAIALLHTLNTQGECEILGIVCSVPVAACVGAVRAINAWYGRPDIPVGWVGMEDEGSPRWSEYMEHRARRRSAHPVDPFYNEYLATCDPRRELPAESAVRLYRRLLSGAEDHSVTICTIGTLTAIERLLDSGPDDLSPLTGLALVAAKVDELVCMTATFYPSGSDVFNWRMDFTAAASVVRSWPTLLTASPHGDLVETGKQFVALTPVGHPVREAYVRFLGGEGRSRPSWDQTASLYAVRRLSGPFALSGPMDLDLDEAMRTHIWRPFNGTGPERRLVVPIEAPADLAARIETLMLGESKYRGPDRGRLR